MEGPPRHPCSCSAQSEQLRPARARPRLEAAQLERSQLCGCKGSSVVTHRGAVLEHHLRRVGRCQHRLEHRSARAASVLSVVGAFKSASRAIRSVSGSNSSLVSACKKRCQLHAEPEPRFQASSALFVPRQHRLPAASARAPPAPLGALAVEVNRDGHKFCLDVQRAPNQHVAGPAGPPASQLGVPAHLDRRSECKSSTCSGVQGPAPRGSQVQFWARCSGTDMSSGLFLHSHRWIRSRPRVRPAASGQSPQHAAIIRSRNAPQQPQANSAAGS